MSNQSTALMAIFAAGTQKPALMQAAQAAKSQGDFKTAIQHNQALLATMQEELTLVESYNRDYEPPFDLTTYAQPLVNTLNEQADLFEMSGDRAQAKALRATAAEVAAGYLGDRGSALVAQSQALALMAEARFHEALDDLARARDLFAQEGDAESVSTVSATLANAYSWLADYERGLAELDKAETWLKTYDRQDFTADEKGVWGAVMAQLRKLEEDVKLHTRWMTIADNRALMMRKLGRYAEAEAIYQEALPAFERSNMGFLVQIHMGCITLKRGDARQGLDLLLDAERQMTGNDWFRARLPSLWRKQAEALFALGDVAAARRKIEAAAADMALYYEADTAWQIYWWRGQILAAAGQPQAALASYDQAIAVVNQMRRAPLGYRLDSTFLREKMPLFIAAINLAAQLGAAGDCARFIELIKARILTATLAQPRQTTGQEAIDQLDELARRLDALAYNAYAEGWTDAAREQQAALQAERTALLERQRLTDPRWRAVTEPVPFDLAQVQATLAGRNQAALTLFVDGNVITSVLITGSEAIVKQLAVAEADANRLDAYLEQLAQAEPDHIQFDPLAATGLTVDGLVDADLLTQALKADSLIIVPHGRLHMLPWNGLGFGGQRLVEHLPLGLLPSLSCLVSLGTPGPAAPSIAVMAAPDYSQFPTLPPLAESEGEVWAIEDVYEPERLLADPVTGPDATEAYFWQLAAVEGAHGAILHIACHGLFDQDDPLSSGLLLSDGKVDAAEIAARAVPFDEIILSACNTGQRSTAVGTVQLLGDDILSLPGAFLEAGAQSVVVSIPPAGDAATTRLMTLYHEQRAAGVTPLRALQAAQKEMLAQAIYSPAQWIGFVVYGCV